MAPASPDRRRTSSARSTAHPLARPVGSNPPGIAHGSNQPPDARRAARHSAITSATSGDSSPTSASPRRRRLTGLCASQVLKMASARCSVAQAAATAGRSSGPGSSPGTMVSENTVPIAVSVWVSSGGRSGPGSLGVPIRSPIAVAVRLT